MELPDQQPRKRRSMAVEFGDQLVQHAREVGDPDKAWLPWPGKLAPASRNTYKNRIDKGQMSSLGHGFEAKVRNRQLFVRYVG